MCCMLSILMTSAPIAAMIIVQKGPACMCEKSMILMPSSGWFTC